MLSALSYGLLVLAPLLRQAVVSTDPMFNKYPAEIRFHGAPAPPLHNTANSRTFRTRIRENEKVGPNFADHYTVASWGCGSSCVMFSIVDATSGKVYDFTEGTVTWSREKNYGVTFRRDSRAIHIVGSLNEGDNSADRWYAWDGSKLELISTKPAQLEQDPQSEN